MNKKDIMLKGIEKADMNMRLNIGGPFGAVVVKDNEIICIVSNTVLKDNDPTAHAEINAIREAGKKLGTYDLTGCELYATGYPCPMCLSAIIWSNIKKVYYCNDVKMAKRIGFRDDFIYDFIKNKEQGNLNGAFSPLHLEELQMEEGQQLYQNYTKLNKIIY